MNLRCYSDGGGRNVPLGMIVPELSPGGELANPTDWVGRLRVGVGMALFSGQAGDSDLHAHDRITSGRSNAEAEHDLEFAVAFS